MAGLAVLNTGQVTRGDTVAVIGCGGVGNAAIDGARLAGAAEITAIDIDDRNFGTARTMGTPMPSTPAPLRWSARCGS